MATGHGGIRKGQGRKSALNEQQIAALSMRCVELTQQYIDNPDVPLKERADVFSKIAAKVVPQSIAVAGEMTHTLFFQEIIDKSKET